MDILEQRKVAEMLFSKIGELTSDGVGVTRESYGSGESAAADFLREFAIDQGLEVSCDRAANLLFRLPQSGVAGPSIWCGSHLDSVPQGGNYDGLAGVVAGLLCLLAQKQSGTPSAVPLQVIGLRGEESAWFGKAYCGSSALFGLLDDDDLALKQRNSGETLATCMQRAGADIEAIRQQKPLFDPSLVRAYLELHIEQGPVMVARKLPLAVVSGIRGNIRHNVVTCLGEAGHSGAVPRWLRRDALFAVADLIMRLD